MHVTKCDVCHKVLAGGPKITVTRLADTYVALDICDKCNKPILGFLKKKGLLKEKGARK